MNPILEEWISPDGSVRLILGDALEVLPLLDREGIGAVVTDPPYGIGWKRGVNNARGSKADDGIVNDSDTTARDGMLATIADVPAAVFGSFYAPFPLKLKQVLVWHKPADAGLVGSVTGFRRDAEPIFLVGAWPFTTVKRSGVLKAACDQFRGHVRTGHPHTKPVDLIEQVLFMCPRGAICDPFMGSGTTGVACIRTGRRFIGIEIEPKYFTIAVDRCKRELERFPLFEQPKARQTELFGERNG